MCDIKKEIKERARLARVLANALGHDADYLYSDAESYDLMCMAESIRETKDTIQKMIDNVMELEYLVYLIKNEGSQ